MTELRRCVSPRFVLARPHLADHDRIDRFQMRRVGLQRQMHAVAGDSMSVEVPRWYFTSPGALHIVGLEALAAEFARTPRSAASSRC